MRASEAVLSSVSRWQRTDAVLRRVLGARAKVEAPRPEAMRDCSRVLLRQIYARAAQAGAIVIAGIQVDLDCFI